MAIIQVRDYIRYKTITITSPEEPLKFKQKVLLAGKREKVFAEVIGLSRELPGARVDEEFVFERCLSETDIKNFELLQKEERQRIRKVQDEADRLKLEMKFFAARVGWEGKVFSFLFVSENPVDFRELLKTIPKEFPGRIHFQRVDSRERAEIIGGVGPCGRTECCSFLRLGNEKVSLDAIRDQGIIIKNNSKIFDVSDKPKRCFLYEVDAYRSHRKYLPHLKQEVSVEGKKAIVMGLDILGQKVRVMFLETEVYENFSIDDVEYPGKPPKAHSEKFECQMPEIEISATEIP